MRATGSRAARLTDQRSVGGRRSRQAAEGASESGAAARSQPRTWRASTSASSAASSGARPAPTSACARPADLLAQRSGHCSLSFSDWKKVYAWSISSSEIAVERLGQLVHREADAVIGDAVLAEVVGADFFRPLARTDLRPSVLRDRLLLLPHLHFVEPRPQHFHRLRAVLDLRFLVLLRHDETGWDVRDADRGVGGVDALTAGAARAEGVDAEILRRRRGCRLLQLPAGRRPSRSTCECGRWLRSPGRAGPGARRSRTSAGCTRAALR